ncbi:SDR family oxidoreductase [Flagellimonas allohymeniacidonis]|uniref:SDR family oxidoreductase n=1 Tax=Flagellimonas allohymeniacidonis TaxID=2517819 RepID=A0A4Q8QJI7_9FLAO|nr:SDR family oxidoreductase [Allomuricauda hymeniacidonis]TAI48649.1 SDR family oxidoreductase [Allomuricauda hymeniacidonis]
MYNLEGKTIWITGASSGIGKALAETLSKEACNLIISSRNAEELEKVKALCEPRGNIEVLTMDLSRHNEMKELIQKAISLFGGVDVLINNAGVSQRSLILDTDFEVYRKLMDINYLGTVALSTALLPHFVENDGGHFVTVTSIMGRFGSPYRSGYCAAKHALHGFFDVLRMEHDKDNVKVTMVCPGFVNTNVAKNALIGDGSLQKENDTATLSGLPPKQVAKQIVKAMRNEKFEVYIGRSEIRGIYLKRFFPKMLHKVVMKSQVR